MIFHSYVSLPEGRLVSKTFLSEKYFAKHLSYTTVQQLRRHQEIVLLSTIGVLILQMTRGQNFHYIQNWHPQLHQMEWNPEFDGLPTTNLQVLYDVPMFHREVPSPWCDFSTLALSNLLSFRLATSICGGLGCVGYFGWGIVIFPNSSAGCLN